MSINKSDPKSDTTDSILHTTHLLFDFLLRTIEINHLIGDLNQLTKFMLKSSIKDYETAEDEKVKKAIYTNITFFSVAGRLLNEKESTPHFVKNVVEDELSLIKNP